MASDSLKAFRASHPFYARYYQLRAEYRARGLKLPAAWRTASRFDEWAAAKGLQRMDRLVPADTRAPVGPFNYRISETRASQKRRGAATKREFIEMDYKKIAEIDAKANAQLKGANDLHAKAKNLCDNGRKYHDDAKAIYDRAEAHLGKVNAMLEEVQNLREEYIKRLGGVDEIVKACDARVEAVEKAHLAVVTSALAPAMKPGMMDTPENREKARAEGFRVPSK